MQRAHNPPSLGVSKQPECVWPVDMQVNTPAGLLGFVSYLCPVVLSETVEQFVLSDLSTPDPLELKTCD